MSVLRYLAALTAAALTGALVGVAVARPAAPTPLLGAVDIGFAQDMAAHHQQAVIMTDMLTVDAAPDVRALAEQIRSTQLVEIGQLTGWLQLVGAPPSAQAPMLWMHPPDTHHENHGAAMAMPGMATTEDLKRLQTASARASETLYLQLMTRHHQGGIDMAAYALRAEAADVVRTAAAQMVSEQTQEIQVMSVLMAQRGTAAMPYP